MQQRRGSTPRGVLTLSLMVLNVIFWVPILMVAALLKLAVPAPAWRRRMSRVMIGLAEIWIGPLFVRDGDGAPCTVLGVRA